MNLEYVNIKYKSGFKYQVSRVASVQTTILGYDVKSQYYTLTEDGVLTALVGYAWDGASKCPDFRSIMRGSLFHDILYQMFRSEELPRHFKGTADGLLKRLCIEDGMWKLFAELVYEAVEKFGAPATHPNHKKREYTAP
jgi:hypothetical protein